MEMIGKKTQNHSHWSWRDDGDNNWIPYDIETGNEIEKNYISKRTSYSFNVKNQKYPQGQHYTIDFQA